MNDLATTYINMQNSAETRRAYERDLRKWAEFAGGLDLFTATPEMVLGFKRHLEDTLSPNSAARTFGTVRGFFKFLSLRTGTGATAFEWVKGPKRPTGVTPSVPNDSDVDAVIEAAQHDPQRSLIVALLLNGLRAGEVTAMAKQDVEFIEDYDHVVLRVNGKGQKQRLVPATIETELAINRFGHQCSDAQKASPWLVSDYDGDQLTVRQVEHAVYKSAEYAGVEGMHPHALRHHYATRLIRAGATPLHVKELLGHASVNTTQVYVTLDMKDLVEAARLDPRNQPKIQIVKEAVG